MARGVGRVGREGRRVVEDEQIGGAGRGGREGR